VGLAPHEVGPSGINVLLIGLKFDGQCGDVVIELVISLARPQSLVLAMVVCKIWKSPLGPVSICQIQFGRVSMGELVLVLAWVNS
jgi:hypothetical protein